MSERPGTFKKGNSAAVKSITKKEAQIMCWNAIHRVIQRACEMPREDLDEFMKSPESGKLSIFEHKALLAYKNGNYKHIEFLKTMVLGKPRQQVEHTTDESGISINYNVIKKKKDA